MSELWEGSYPRDEGCADGHPTSTHPTILLLRKLTFQGKGFAYFMEEMGKFERNLLHMKKQSLWAGKVAPSEGCFLHKCEHLNLVPGTHIMTCTLIPVLGVGGDCRSLGLTSQQT